MPPGILARHRRRDVGWFSGTWAQLSCTQVRITWQRGSVCRNPIRVPQGGGIPALFIQLIRSIRQDPSHLLYGDILASQDRIPDQQALRAVLPGAPQTLCLGEQSSRKEGLSDLQHTLPDLVVCPPLRMEKGGKGAMRHPPLGAVRILVVILAQPILDVRADRNTGRQAPHQT